jgi:hypothetical protein
MMLRKPRLENLERREVFSANPMLLPADGPLRTADAAAEASNLVADTVPTELEISSSLAAVSVPAFDGSSKDPCYFTVQVAPDRASLQREIVSATQEKNAVDQIMARDSSVSVALGKMGALVDSLAWDRVSAVTRVSPDVIDPAY